MDYNKLLQMILDIAEEMLVSGAEVSRVTDSILRIARAYGCIDDRTNAFVITANIQVTIETPEGQIITQIRRVIRNETNYDRLDKLNDLSRYICSNTPNLEEIRERFMKIMKRKRHRKWIDLLGAAMVAGGFAVFFGGNVVDGLLAGILGMAIARTIEFLGKYDENPLARIFTTSMGAGLLAILLVYVTLGIFQYSAHMDKIIIGGIMLMIPGIALTNALRDMLIGELVTGLLRLCHSLLIAISIACGFALALMLLGDAFALRQSTANFNGNSVLIQLLGTFIGSLGFAVFFNIKGNKIIYSALGSAGTWAMYLAIFKVVEEIFTANLIAALFVGIFGEVMARLTRTPSTVYITSAAVPLIPGGALYYAMAGILMGNESQFRDSGTACLITALAIALGFIVIAVLNKYYFLIKNKKLSE